jgi:DNA-binding NarL/FixJ family response regulator
MSKIRVGIVEDDIEYRESLIKFLSYEEDMEVVFQAGSKQEVLNNPHFASIDVLLMDINLKGDEIAGINLTREIVKSNPPIKIIMLTSYEERRFVIDSGQAGAVNYIPKSHFMMLPDVIRQAVDGFSPFEIVAEESKKKDIRFRINELTKTEKEVYKLVQKSLTRSEIAKSLFITENSVKNLISRMLKKLEVRNCKELREKI